MHRRILPLAGAVALILVLVALMPLDGSLQERQLEGRATLCRCGRSQNKPWCDGRHKKREGFR